MISERTFWYCDNLRGSDFQDYVDVHDQPTEPASWEKANLIGSLIAGSELHAPAIDNDHQSYLDGRRLGVTIVNPKARMLNHDLQRRAALEVEETGFADVVQVSEQDTERHQAVSMELTASGLLLPSRSQGHFHLYTEHTMQRKNYIHLLNLLVAVGIVQKGFANAANVRNMSHLRKPSSTDGMSRLEAAAFLSEQTMRQ